MYTPLSCPPVLTSLTASPTHAGAELSTVPFSLCQHNKSAAAGRANNAFSGDPGGCFVSRAGRTHLCQHGRRQRDDDDNSSTSATFILCLFRRQICLPSSQLPSPGSLFFGLLFFLLPSASARSLSVSHTHTYAHRQTDRQTYIQTETPLLHPLANSTIVFYRSPSVLFTLLSCSD